MYSSPNPVVEWIDHWTCVRGIRFFYIDSADWLTIIRFSVTQIALPHSDEIEERCKENLTWRHDRQTTNIIGQSSKLTCGKQRTVVTWWSIMNVIHRNMSFPVNWNEYFLQENTYRKN